jgi:hypothetical protein
MSSEARIIANRLNAQKSTGPRTAEGKAAVSQNAVTHGLSAQCDVIRGEDQEEFDQYREEMFWELNPVGAMQSRLAERIVSLAWRLRRAERIQNEAFDALLTKETSSPLARLTRSLRGKEQDGGDSGGCDGDPAVGRTVVRDFSDARVLDRLLMYERRIESSLYRTMNELQKLQRGRELEADGGHSPPYKTCNTGDASPGEETPEGVTPNGTDCAKQSQSTEVDGTVCSVPVRASLETQDVASLRGVGASAADCAKQSQSPPGDGVHGTPCESGDASPGEETPDGVTTNASDCAEQSQATTEVSREKDPASIPPTSNLTLDTSNPSSGVTPPGSGAGVRCGSGDAEFAGCV